MNTPLGIDIIASNLWFPIISFLIALWAFELPNNTPSGTIEAHLPPIFNILKNKDKTKETQEPKQPEPVEDTDNKDKTLESEDKQIDDDLSSEENKDINTETDNNNIERLSDTDTEETDMNNKEKDSNVRFSAFGIDLTFEVPDFVIVSKT